MLIGKTMETCILVGLDLDVIIGRTR